MKKIIIAFSILLSSQLYAQNNLTLYNMSNVPQNLHVNPASEFKGTWYFGTPALSSIDLNFNSNGLALRQFNNAFVPQGNDSFKFDISKLSDVLDKNTFINLGVNQEWINFGFRVGKNNLFTANITEKIKTRVSIPGDFFKFVFEGNGGENLGYQFMFDWGIDFMHIREYAIGYQRSLLNDRLRVGGKLKYIYGISTVNTEKNDLTFTTAEDNYHWNVSSDIKVNAATSLMPISENSEPDISRLLYGADNSGFGIDLGASFDLSDMITLSASVIDLGYINWNENTINVQSRNPGATFEFRGIDIKEFFDDSSSTQEGFQELSDSVLAVFALDTFSNIFTTGLLGEFYLGANLNITERSNVAALFYGSFYNQQFYPAITLSFNTAIGRWLGASVSYSSMRGNYANIGGGLSINAGPEQFYFASDNLIGAATGNVRNLTLRFGWNHTFGRKKYQMRRL